MGKQIHIEVVKNKLYILCGDVVCIDETTYKGTSKKAKFIDKVYGEWFATPSHVLKGKSHPLRGKEKFKISNTTKIKEIKEKLAKIYNGIVVIDDNTYTNLTTKAKFIDKDYGSWWAIPFNVLKGHRNPKIKGEILKLRKLSIDEIKNRIKNIHGDNVVLKEESYKSINKRAIFMDKDYGEFSTFVNNVLVGKGHEKRGYKKLSKSLNNYFSLSHWNTGEEIFCQGTWEQKVVFYLNKNKINFLWKPKKFLTDLLKQNGNKRTYEPDFYLVDKNLWIEIKGLMRKDAQKKWEWFHKEHPNSELWDKKKLKELGIL